MSLKYSPSRAFQEKLFDQIKGKPLDDAVEYLQSIDLDVLDGNAGYQGTLHLEDTTTVAIYYTDGVVDGAKFISNQFYRTTGNIVFKGLNAVENTKPINTNRLLKPKINGHYKNDKTDAKQTNYKTQ